MSPVIAISGLHGTGKSTFARRLAKKLALKYHSTGVAFRKLAKERGLTLEEFTAYAEKNSEIDKALDERTIKEAKNGNVIIESQLAGWLTKELADLKILLTAPFEVRIFRMMERDHRSREETIQETTKREKSEVKRYEELYGININDYSVYDLIINTNKWSIDEILDMLVSMINLIIRKT